MQTGTISSAAQSNSYTFSANANDVVSFTIAAKSGLSPRIKLFNGAGALVTQGYSNSPGGCGGGAAVELNTVTLATAGTYTALISDCFDTGTGSYTAYAQRTNNPAGAGALSFGQVQTGTITSAAQSNSYTFSANANDVMPDRRHGQASAPGSSFSTAQERWSPKATVTALEAAVVAPP